MTENTELKMPHQCNKINSLKNTLGLSLNILGIKTDKRYFCSGWTVNLQDYNKNSKI
jgi:hypothetical protein